MAKHYITLEGDNNPLANFMSLVNIIRNGRHLRKFPHGNESHSYGNLPMMQTRLRKIL